MTDAELKELVASLAIAQRETAEQMKRTDRRLKELGKQIGGLGEKFGSFTEGLALPSMQKILNERFGMEVISPSVRASKNGKHYGNRRAGLCQQRQEHGLYRRGQKPPPPRSHTPDGNHPQGFPGVFP